MILNFKKNIIKNKIFKIISKISNKLNFHTYLIGGYVRNFFLFKKHSLDIDIVTTGNSIILAKYFIKKILIKNLFIFKRFKTAIVKYKNYNIEFVSTRKEYYNIYNNKPKIKKLKNLFEDQLRRDFTINTIAISLNKKNYGKIIDPLNGLNDLKKKIIKTPIDPNITFYEDPLRMIRAIRFYTILKFNIDKNLIKSIKNNIDRIRIISIERIIQEFNKIILSKKPSIGLKLMFKLGFLNIILPELVSLKKEEKNKKFSYKDNFNHSLKVIDNISKKTDNLWLKWAALLHDIGKPVSKKFIYNKGWTFYLHEIIGSNMIPQIFYRLKLPIKKNMKYVQKIIKYSYKPIYLSKKNVKISTIKKFILEIGSKNIEDLILLCNSDITTKYKKKKKKLIKKVELLLNKIKKKKKKKKKKLIKKVELLLNKIKKIQKIDKINNIKLPINGNDIIRIFKIKPCKKIGIIKKYIINSIIKGKINNDYKSVYKLMIKKGKELNLKLNE